MKTYLPVNHSLLAVVVTGLRLVRSKAANAADALDVPTINFVVPLLLVTYQRPLV
jgi:hypothetical protein